MSMQVSIDEYRQEWLADVTAGNPSTTELGRRFARKLILQWLDVDQDTADDLIYCDGAGDGGIDLAYLQRGESGEARQTGNNGSSQADGDTWYLVQSKYGSAFRGSTTLFAEAQKVLDTLAGRRHLSSIGEDVQQRLTMFLARASDRDRLILVFATPEPLSDNERRVLHSIRAMGREQLGPIFDVEAVSIDTVYDRVVEAAASAGLTVELNAQPTSSGSDLLVVPTALLSLYKFLKAYRDSTGDLDQLYEKNVRRFLGTGRRVNKAMRQTLQETPELFGLYNNGITIVVTDFQSDEGTIRLRDPYIVNGCQTTRSIWDVFHQRLDAGGTGHSATFEAWHEKASRAVVVTKIVRVGTDANSEDLLLRITRYTNSQNAVSEKDFLALTSDFKRWADQMGTEYGIYLETQRGGWDSRRALQRQHPALRPQYDKWANAFDLVKVYGAGWRGEAGTAFGKNGPFVPGGAIFRAIMAPDANGDAFGVDDLHAAYLLQEAAKPFNFGRGASQNSRRQTRFLFYMVVGELLKDVLVRANESATPKALTKAWLALACAEDTTGRDHLLDAAVDVVDEYLNRAAEDCVYNEPGFQSDFNSDLNGYLKWDEMGKTEAASPRFRSLLGAYKITLGRRTGGQPSPREVMTQIIRAGNARAATE